MFVTESTTALMVVVVVTHIRAGQHLRAHLQQLVNVGQLAFDQFRFPLIVRRSHIHVVRVAGAIEARSQ